MFPDLSYFFNYVFGTEVDNWSSVFKTFGVFLILAFIFAHRILKSEMMRKESEGLIKPFSAKNTSSSGFAFKEALLNGAIAFLFAYKIPYVWQNFTEFKLNPVAMIFSREGHMFLGGLLGGLVAMYYYFSAKNLIEDMQEQNQEVHAHRRVGSIILIAAIAGFAGARLFSILENIDDFLQDPFGQLLSGSGLTVYGGFILAFVAVYFYVKKMNINPIHIMDITGLAFPVAYGVGRLGCHFSGDGDWGIVNGHDQPSWFIFPDWLWSYNYPHNVLMEGEKIKDCIGIYCNQLVEGVYPTSVYEFVFSILLFFILWKNRLSFKNPGVLFFTFLAFHGMQRFLIEIIRVNPRYDLFGLNWSLSQSLAFLFTIIGIIGIIYCKTKGRPNKTKEPVNYSQIGHQI